MPAQDPSEPFDLYAEDGTPLGRSKPRAQVHRDGDWHKSLHVWVLLLDGKQPARVLFQRRSPAKDTWPGALDVAVAGHYRAGEALPEALRESYEEIGLTLRPEDVVRLGTRRRVHRTDRVDDREIQEIYATVTRRPLVRFELDPEEVTAVVSLDLGDALRLLRGEAERAPGQARTADPIVFSAPEVTRADFIPDADGYYPRALASLQALARGEQPEPWTLP